MFSEQVHRVKLERVLLYISEHLEASLTVEDAAKVAGLSPFHFHRVFNAQVGESVGRYVTRQRLELSALRLAYERQRSVTDISLSSGYSSSSNFSKAFAAHFECSPSRLRQPDTALPSKVGKLTTRYGKGCTPADLYSAEAERDQQVVKKNAQRWNQSVRFEDAGPLDFACVSSTEGYFLAELERMWERLIDGAIQLDLAKGGVDAWGVVHDSPFITRPESSAATTPASPVGLTCLSVTVAKRKPCPWISPTTPAYAKG